jgi:SAM-dependent methyltransferase
MEDVQGRVARQRSAGAYDTAIDILEDPDEVPLEFERPIDRLSEASQVVGRRETLIATGSAGAATTFLRRAVVRLIAPFLSDLVRQMNAFNAEAVHYLRAQEEARTDERLRDVESRLQPLALHDAVVLRDDGGDAIGYTSGGGGVQDDLYRGFQDVFRESEDTIRERQRFYLDLLAGREPILDLGCGRGELLELLREAGIAASGIDLDPGMVARSREKGLDVELAEVVAYLESRPDESYGAIFSAQLIEHLEYDAFLRLLALARAKLVQGGLFVAETVNPHSILALRSFWLDPTHRAPLYPEVTVLLSGLSGFDSVRAIFPGGSGELETDRRECGDYAVVAAKGGT